MTRPEKIADTEYEDHPLTEVRETEESWEIGADGTFLSIPKVEGIEPKVGSTARYYGKGFGYPVRGVDIDGREVYYRSAAEEREHHQNQVAEMHREKRAKAEASKEDTARRVAALPDVMRRRIQKFRDTNPDFEWEFLPYELFCCEEAVKLAQHFANPADPLAGDKALDEWRQKGYAEQKAQVPELGDDHSGNTFGMAVRLAHWLLTEPEMVVRDHGALTPLVGCKDYGCPHPEEAVPV